MSVQGAPRPIFVQTGRLGDVLNAVPLAWLHFQRTGIRPLFMTAKAFAPILDGFSFLEPVVFDGDWMDAIQATFQARRLSPDVRVSQICAKGFVNARTCSSFARESWATAGSDVPWGTLPLVVDRRSPEREALVLEQAGLDGRPLVLLSLGGVSSPFHRSQFVEALVKERLGVDFQVLNLDEIRVARLYDLLGLYEAAHCLLTTDTATLHLAHATPALPVVSLITRAPNAWHGSPWRPQHVGRIFYDEIPDRAEHLLERIRNARRADLRPRIVHVWADFRTDEGPSPDDVRRMGVARDSWDQEQEFGECWLQTRFPVNRARTSREVGDPRPVPFIQDMIAHAARFCLSPDDVIGWTNSDVSFAPGLTGHILDRCARHGAAFTHRWDLHDAQLRAPFTHEGQVRRLKWYPGSDAFFFTLRWWRQNGADFPDMVMGREHNDEIFRQLVKLRGGVDTEIEAGIYHEKHASFWESPEAFKDNPGNNYNRRLAKGFFERFALKPGDYDWWTRDADRKTR